MFFELVLTACVAFAFGMIVSVFFFLRKNQTVDGKINTDYFKGLNFLLNEEPDKAIEVFIKALEVDSETVELHLALGGLFRKKGQLDRATRIHQNLIARPNLTNEQRLQAIYELAQDYFKVGLFDRAENLFLELKDSVSYRLQAIKGLCSIYQKEKEWEKAINICDQFKRSERSDYKKNIAHYWCELAQESLDKKDLMGTEKKLKSAISEDSASLRAVFLQGELYYHQQRYQKAIVTWETLSQHPHLGDLLFNHLLQAHIDLDDESQLSHFLYNLIELPFDENNFKGLINALKKNININDLINYLIDLLPCEIVNHVSLDYLYTLLEKDELSHQQKKALLTKVMMASRRQHATHACSRCGFQSNNLLWLCPSCEHWDSFR